MRIEHTKPRLDGSSSLVLTVGGYRVVVSAFQGQGEHFEVGELWLLNSDDEGMSLHEPEFEKMLAEHFRENF